MPVAIKVQKFPREKIENVIAFESEDVDVHHIPRLDVYRKWEEYKVRIEPFR